MTTRYTPNRTYPYPEDADPPEGSGQIEALALAVDTDMQAVTEAATGRSGSVWYIGESGPDADVTDPVEGDCYMYASSGDVFQYNASAWAYKMNLVGYTHAGDGIDVTTAADNSFTVSVRPSADAGNAAAFGSDGGLYVPRENDPTCYPIPLAADFKESGGGTDIWWYHQGGRIYLAGRVVRADGGAITGSGNLTIATLSDAIARPRAQVQLPMAVTHTSANADMMRVDAYSSGTIQIVLPATTSAATWLNLCGMSWPAVSYDPAQLPAGGAPFSEVVT